MSKDTTDLSVIITAHAEGVLLHKTVKSIRRALEHIAEEYTSEIVLHVDNPTEATSSYISDHLDTTLRGIRVFYNAFGDLSTSRNFAIKKARGKYIAITDGDDLYTRTVFKNALDILHEEKREIIVHPKYVVSFGVINTNDEKVSSGDKVTDTLKLLNENLWGSNCVAPRSVFLSHPYQANNHIYGFEDMLFNAETLHAGIPHVVTDDALFYRRKVASLLASQSVVHAELRKSGLFDFELLREFDVDALYKKEFLKEKVAQQASALVRMAVLSRRLVFEYHAANKRVSRKYRMAVNRLFLKRQQRKGMVRIEEERKRLQRFPQWLVDEWKELHKIEQQIFPSQGLLKNMKWYEGDQNIRPGLVYVKLVQNLKKKPDTLFFVPWLVRGGGDKVFINYINEVATTKDWSVAVLQTLGGVESVWAPKLDEVVDFVDFASLASGVNSNVQMRLMAKFIVQNDIKRVFVASSAFGFALVERYENLLRGLGVTVYTFAFAEGYDKEGRRVGYVHSDIPKVYDISHKIITDNSKIVELLVDEYGILPDKFAVHHQPAYVDMSTVKRLTVEDRPMRILWASRVCRSKRPDLLKGVADKLARLNIKVDAYGSLEEGYSQDYFEDSAVNYKRAFNGIADLPLQDYDAFLYTSESDGIPNVLQEMMHAGLPIIASNVGGISEIVKNNVTGKLVDDIENIDSYVVAVKQLVDKKERRRLVEGADKLLKESLNKEVWRQLVQRDIDR